jgi:hypothetical protein
MKRWFKVSKGFANTFSASWESKKAILTKSLKWCFTYAKALRTHILPSERFNKRLWWSRWCDGSRSRKAIRTYILHAEHRKERFLRRFLSNVWSRRMKLIIQNLPSESLKKGLWWIRWGVVSRCRNQPQSNFRHTWHWKKRLGRCCLRDVLSRQMDLRTYNLPSGRLKKRIWRSRWSVVSKCPKTMWTHFLHHGHQKKRLGRSRLSDVLSIRMGMWTHNLPSERL